MPNCETFSRPHGTVEKVNLVTDRDTGRSRGFAFIEMTDASAADKAITALNGTDLGGRPLMVNEARPKSDRPRSAATFTKRQKEQTRQQKQREKAARRNQRKQEKPESARVDEIDDLRENAEAQAALFRMGSEQLTTLDPASFPKKPSG
jgi:RNA recognition motif-containing protein